MSKKHSLTRRSFLAGTVGSALWMPADASGQPPGKLNICVAESLAFRLHSKDLILARFKEYADAGIDLLRASISFRSQKEDGAWNPQTDLWFELAASLGFRFKIEFETLSGPPRWLLNQNQNARIVNEQGEISYNDLNPFWSDLESTLTQQNRKLVAWWNKQGFRERTEYVIVDLGPAGEPIYPATWTLGPGHVSNKWNFWFYGSGASENFRAAMQTKYGSLAAINSHWGTQFASPNEVVVPRPNCCTTSYWLDAVEWYRNVKRQLVKWQLDETKRLVSPSKTMILLPGTHLSSSDIAKDIDRGESSYAITLMPDTEFVVDLALRSSSALQYTGIPNEPEMVYIEDLIKNSPSPTALWCENIGNYKAASVMINSYMIGSARNNIQGIDLVDASILYGTNGDSPTPLKPIFLQASRNLR